MKVAKRNSTAGESLPCVFLELGIKSGMQWEEPPGTWSGPRTAKTSLGRIHESDTTPNLRPGGSRGGVAVRRCCFPKCNEWGLSSLVSLWTVNTNLMPPAEWRGGRFCTQKTNLQTGGSRGWENAMCGICHHWSFSLVPVSTIMIPPAVSMRVSHRGGG